MSVRRTPARAAAATTPAPKKQLRAVLELDGEDDDSNSSDNDSEDDYAAKKRAAAAATKRLAATSDAKSSNENDEEDEDDVFSFASARKEAAARSRIQQEPASVARKKRPRDDNEEKDNEEGASATKTAKSRPPTKKARIEKKQHEEEAEALPTKEKKKKTQEEKQQLLQEDKKQRQQEEANSGDEDPATREPSLRGRIVRAAKRDAGSVLYPKRFKAATENAPDSPSSSSQLSQRRIVISLTGFGKPGHACDLAMEQTLLRAVVKAFGPSAVRSSSDELAAEVTHVVAPRDVRTHKTLAALLSGRWLVPPQWLTDSARASCFLPVQRFGGVQGVRGRFQGLRLYTTPAFLEQVQRRGVDRGTLSLLLETMGRATLCAEPLVADLCLIATPEPNAALLPPSIKTRTWKQLLDEIQPPQ